MELTVQAGGGDGVVTLAVGGDFDLASAGEFESRVAQLIAAGDTRIVVDAQELAFCDSVGLNTLVRTQHHCEASGGWLRVIHTRGEVAQVLRISGLFDHLASSDQPSP